MKFVSWNVNGLRAIMNKGFEDIFKSFDADAFCLQETKLQQGQIDLSFEGYDDYWNYAEKKGYSGTAVFTKTKPISACYGFGIAEHDKENDLMYLLEETITEDTTLTDINDILRFDSDWVLEQLGINEEEE